jgi:hypothetical protein
VTEPAGVPLIISPSPAPRALDRARAHVGQDDFAVEDALAGRPGAGERGPLPIIGKSTHSFDQAWRRRRGRIHRLRSLSHSTKAPTRDRTDDIRASTKP